MELTFLFYLFGYAFGILNIIFLTSLTINVTFFSGFLYDPAILAAFYTTLLGLVLVYTTLRSQNLVPKYFIKFASSIHFLTCIAVYLRGARFKNIPLSIPDYIFLVVGPLTWICCCYSIYCIGKLIRSNPGSVYDSRQQRLERISNIVVILGGGIQIINFVISFTTMQVFVIPITASTLSKLQ